MKSRRPRITPKMLARVIAEATGCTKAHSELAMQRLSDQIIAEMKAGKEVRLDRIGALYATVRPSYVQNVPIPPRGGIAQRPSSEKHTVPAMLVPRFRALPSLKRALAS